MEKSTKTKITMKKIALLLCGAFIYLATFGQAINDRAVIPVSVNLVSILRLTIKSGGNIEFTFNTIDDYNTGVTAGVVTQFTVASSQNFDVVFDSESANLIGTDSATHSIPGTEVIMAIAGATGTITTPTNISAINGGLDVIEDGVAGDATANAYTITWTCGTSGNLLGYPPDRYATNVFLTLQGSD